MLTKIKLHNLNQASAAIYWPNFSFKIVPENLDQILYSKSEQKFDFIKPNFSFQIYTKLSLTCFSASTSATVSNNISKFWVGIFTRYSHISQVHKTGDSELIS